MDAIISTLTASLQELLAYTRKRTGDDALAADVLQESLLKVVRSAPALRDQDSLFPWFYRILDNTITDRYRGLQREQERNLQYALETESVVPPEDKSAICQCFLRLLPAMKPSYAEVIQALDLDEEDPAGVAARMGITRGNLKVRHHRARRQLLELLENTCRVCAKHGCLDCSCSRPL